MTLEVKGTDQYGPCQFERHHDVACITLKEMRDTVSDHYGVKGSRIEMWHEDGTLLPLSSDSKKLSELGYTGYGMKMYYTVPTMWDILDIQEIDGSWSSSILDVVQLSESDVSGAISEQLSSLGLSTTDKMTVIYTWLALKYLSSFYSDKSAEWKLVAMKGKMWAQSKSANLDQLSFDLTLESPWV